MGAKGLSTRLVSQDDLRAWDALASQHGGLFDSIRWTGLFEAGIRRIGIFDAGGSLRGGFCVWEQRKLGLRVLRNPPFTPHVGPFFEYRASNRAARTDEARDVMESMATFLDHSGAAVVSLGIALEVKDCLPLSWRGYKVVPHYTYRIDLAQTEDILMTAMSSSRRNDVRKAIADGVAVKDTGDTLAMRALAMETYARQHTAFAPAPTDLVFSRFPPRCNSYCLIAEANGRPLAGVYVVHDARTAYYLVGGYADGAHHGAGALAMWHAILKARQLGLQVFDFEGSMIPPIERYFRGFGGQLTPCFSLNKAWLPIEMALKVLPRYRNRF